MNQRAACPSPGQELESVVWFREAGLIREGEAPAEPGMAQSGIPCAARSHLALPSEPARNHTLAHTPLTLPRRGGIFLDALGIPRPGVTNPYSKEDAQSAFRAMVGRAGKPSGLAGFSFLPGICDPVQPASLSRHNDGGGGSHSCKKEIPHERSTPIR